MMFIWQKIKIWLLIGMLYAVYYAIRSTKALKRIEIPRINWGERN
jgi:hypothetical protein